MNRTIHVLAVGAMLVALPSCMQQSDDNHSPLSPNVVYDRSPAIQAVAMPLDDRAFIYWDTTAACSPSGRVGAFKPTTYSAPAPTVTVTNARDNGAGSLRAAVAQVASGGRIGFAVAMKDSTVRLDSQIVIGKTVIIDAMAAYGVSLDGRSRTRFFSLNSNTDATFIGLRMTRGKAVGGDAPGGALCTGNDCRLTIRYCIFSRDTADRGGAVWAGYGTYTRVEDCTFVGNDGSGANNGFSAGGISAYMHGELIVKRSLFVRNRGYSGAAIYNILQPVTVDSCVMMGNYAEMNGAALFSDEGNWTGPGATVGGHIFVRNCWMEDNVSHELGGALFPWANPKDTVNIENCMLKNNSCELGGQWSDSKGGAIRANGILTIRNVTFVGNHAVKQGGALWIDAVSARIVNCTFLGNRVDDDQGGAITINTGANAPVDIINCTIVGNYAGRACGGFWIGGETWPVSISNSVVAYNRAGQDAGQNQIGYQPIDSGGNVEYPAPVSGGRKVAAGSLVQEPVLDSIAISRGMLVLPLKSTSPAIGRAVARKAPTTDARGTTRDGSPDAGAFEYAAGDNTLRWCNPSSVRMSVRGRTFATY